MQEHPMAREHPAPVPHFQAALRANEAAQLALPYSTRQRRLDGWLPPIFNWLLQHPDLIDALAADARAQPNAAASFDEAA
jgi:hypothetical protein